MLIQFATVSTPVYLWPYSDLIFFGTIDTNTLTLRRIDPYRGRRPR